MAGPKKGDQVGPKRGAGNVAGKTRKIAESLPEGRSRPPMAPGGERTSNTVGNPNSRVAADKRGEATERRLKSNRQAQNREVRANRAAGAAKSAARKAATGMAMRAAGPIGAAATAIQGAKAIDRMQRGEPKASSSGGQMSRKNRK